MGSWDEREVVDIHGGMSYDLKIRLVGVDIFIRNKLSDPSFAHSTLHGVYLLADMLSVESLIFVS
jgi:hypothetical protein